MKKTLVLYRSKSGFSKEYAMLFQQHLQSEIEEYKRFLPKYNEYDEIFYIGGLYIGGINGFKSLKKGLLEKQKVHVFAVGASPGNDSDLKEIIKHNFKDDELKRYHFHYLRGGFDFEKCNRIDQFLMTLLKWKLKRIKNPTGDQKGMLASYEKPLKFVSEQKVIDYLHTIK